MLLEFTLHSAKNVQSNQSTLLAQHPKPHVFWRPQATPAAVYTFGLKCPKTEKKYFEIHYTSKWRVIVCSSLENISHAVHWATEPQSTELWCSKMQSQSENKKVQRAEGRVEGCYRAVTRRRLPPWESTANVPASESSVQFKPPATALDTREARGGK